MIKCKVAACPFLNSGFCERRVGIINEFGLCGFLFKGQQPREIHTTDWEYIKNPMMFADFVDKQEQNKEKGEEQL